MVAEMLQKYIFIFNIFFYLKNHICLYSIKKIFFFCKNFSFKENIFIFNQNIFIFNQNIFISNQNIFIFNQNIFIFTQNIFISNQNIFIFFSYKKYIFIQSKKMCLMKYFYSMIIGSQIWSSIC